MKKNVTIDKPMPTINITMYGYRIEIKKQITENSPLIWTNLPISSGKIGVPLPEGGRGILETIGMYGYKQAMALAWWAKASSIEEIDIRIIPYKIQCGIECWKIEKEIEYIGKEKK